MGERGRCEIWLTEGGKGKRDVWKRVFGMEMAFRAKGQSWGMEKMVWHREENDQLAEAKRPRAEIRAECSCSFAWKDETIADRVNYSEGEEATTSQSGNKEIKK
jgi:hypothetical protein